MAQHSAAPDNLTPKEIAEYVEELGQKKTGYSATTTLMLAGAAGAFVSMGAQFYLAVVHDSKLSFGMTGFIGGLAFNLGLVLIVLAGAELFTGNILVSLGAVQGRYPLSRVLRNWGLVWTGNFIGALFMVTLFYWGGIPDMNGGLIGAKTLSVAYTKAHLPWTTAFIRGILCNIFVVLAVWVVYGGRTTIDRIAAMILPIAAFVALGFEHSVANMFYFPMAYLLSKRPEMVTLAEQTYSKTFDLASLSPLHWIPGNLVPVTLGNIVGGLIVGLLYWAVYLRKDSKVQVRKAA